ncbi:MAG: response regulator transcription factor [Bryobacteraceae bacterium]
MSVDSPITIFACESEPVVLEGLERVLAPCEDLQLVGSAGSLVEALQALPKFTPNVILMDHSAGLRSAFQFISDARSVSPQTQPVLWVIELTEIECFRALQMGARGIVKKTMPVATLLECLRAVGGGSIWVENSISSQVTGFLNRKQAPRLTPREREIVRTVCQGMKNKQIGEALQITAGTVKVHLMHIFEKTGAKDRFELAIYGRRLLGFDGDREPSERSGPRGTKSNFL